MKYTFRKDKIRRNRFAKFETSARFLKIATVDQSVELPKRAQFANRLNSKKQLSNTKIKNHCSLSFRSGGILTEFGLSRIKFRELARNAILPGVQKSSW